MGFHQMIWLYFQLIDNSQKFIFAKIVRINRLKSRLVLLLAHNHYICFQYLTHYVKNCTLFCDDMRLSELANAYQNWSQIKRLVGFGIESFNFFAHKHKRSMILISSL